MLITGIILFVFGVISCFHCVFKLDALFQETKLLGQKHGETPSWWNASVDFPRFAKKYAPHAKALGLRYFAFCLLSWLPFAIWIYLYEMRGVGTWSARFCSLERPAYYLLPDPCLML